MGFPVDEWIVRANKSSLLWHWTQKFDFQDVYTQKILLWGIKSRTLPNSSRCLKWG